jgi:DNA-binding NarL/FixJ family response regulator
MCIVLADDDDAYRHQTKALLQRVAGLDVVGETSYGRGAIRLVDELRPDLLVTDTMLPRLNGMEATRQIVTTHAGFFVIGLALSDDKFLVEAMLAAGASGYVLKDSAAIELANAIETVAAGGIFISAAISGVKLSRP